VERGSSLRDGVDNSPVRRQIGVAPVAIVLERQDRVVAQNPIRWFADCKTPVGWHVV
jgi:hypothetical protein